MSCELPATGGAQVDRCVRCAPGRIRLDLTQRHQISTAKSTLVSGLDTEATQYGRLGLKFGSLRPHQDIKSEVPETFTLKEAA